MAHRLAIAAPKPRAVIGSPWWVRKAVYVVVTIVGLVAVAFGWVQPDQVDQWVTQLGSLAAVIGGGMAAMNTGWESDEKPVAVEVAAPSLDGFTAYPQEVGHAN